MSEKKEKKEKKRKSKGEKKEESKNTPKKQRVEVRDDEILELAKPMANEKEIKKLLELTESATKVKSIRRGVKEVNKYVRKGEKG